MVTECLYGCMCWGRNVCLLKNNLIFLLRVKTQSLWKPQTNKNETEAIKTGNGNNSNVWKSTMWQEGDTQHRRFPPEKLTNLILGSW